MSSTSTFIKNIASVGIGLQYPQHLLIEFPNVFYELRNLIVVIVLLIDDIT